MVRLAIILFVAFAACAAGSAGRVSPGSPGSEPPFGSEPPGTVPTVAPPSGADRSGAEADFVNAKSRFDQGDEVGARAALDDFSARHADDPMRPSADVLRARLALVRGEPAAAKGLLEPLSGEAAPTPPPATPTPPPGSDEAARAAGVAASARYFLGLAELRLGNARRARELLLPYLAKVPKSSGGEDSAVELYGALAEATAGSGDAAGAIALWDTYFQAAKEHERAFARMRAEQLAAQLSGEASWRAFGAAPQAGLGRAVLGPRAAVYLRGQGDASGATFIDGETAKARHALGFDESGQRVGPGDPTRLGLALPLSGKFQPVGEATLRAAMLAAGSPGDGSGSPSGAAAVSQLVVRDTGTDAERAAHGVSELTREEAVIGILGAGERKAGAAALAEATQDGIPLLALDDQAPGALSTGFQLIHSPEARVAELARRALKMGVRDFAILGPDSASGKRLREAFRREVTAGGGRITAEATYVAGVTSFSGPVAAVKKSPPQAVFVPDSADRLELIAPALAFADLWPQPWTPKGAAGQGRPRAPAEPGKPRTRNILLLSTANDLSPKLLQNAGRYVQGALLSPGFFADEGDDRARAFVDAYRAAYGQDPHATEAYAYDGVRLIRSTTDAGARTRADLLKALSAVAFQGLTGTIRFGADHGRVDPPLVYVVDGEQIRAAR